MNKITEIFKSITNEELEKAINEIEEDSKTGFIRDGVVRKYAKIIGDITNSNVSINLMAAEINLLREAAYRWANLINII